MTFRCRLREIALFATVPAVAIPVWGLDVVKISPETHKVLLENERARVLDVHAKPGEKVAMHSHPASILYYLTDGKLRITYPDGRTEERTVKAGTAVWSEPVTHAVENVGVNELNELHTELKGANR